MPALAQKMSIWQVKRGFPPAAGAESITPDYGIKRSAAAYPQNVIFDASTGKKSRRPARLCHD